jgi:hypothetical protein
MIDGVALGQVEVSCDLADLAAELPGAGAQLFSLQCVASAQRVDGIATHPSAGLTDALDVFPLARCELKLGLMPTISKAVTVSTIFQHPGAPADLIVPAPSRHGAANRPRRRRGEEVLTADSMSNDSSIALQAKLSDGVGHQAATTVTTRNYRL